MKLSPLLLLDMRGFNKRNTVSMKNPWWDVNIFIALHFHFLAEENLQAAIIVLMNVNLRSLFVNPWFTSSRLHEWVWSSIDFCS